MKQELFQQLEQMVDKHTIAEVLETLTEVCSAKAEHVATNWLDMHVAAEWQAIANALVAIPARIL